MNLQTPDSINKDIDDIIADLGECEREVYRAEVKFGKLKLAAEKAELVAFTQAGGTVADRQAVAKLKAYEAVEEMKHAEAVMNYQKAHQLNLRAILNAKQTQAGLVQTLFRAQLNR